MRTRPYMALLLIGFLLLTACGGGGSSDEIGASETSTTNCTLDTSALDSCTLN